MRSSKSQNFRDGYYGQRQALPIGDSNSRRPIPSRPEGDQHRNFVQTHRHWPGDQRTQRHWASFAQATRPPTKKLSSRIEVPDLSIPKSGEDRLKELKETVSQLNQEHVRLTAVQVRLLLYGLKSYVPKDREVKDREMHAEVLLMLDALAKKIPYVKNFNGQVIGNALFGLKNLSDGPQVRAVLNALAEKIKDVKDFKGEGIGMALLGLKNLRDSPGVRAVLNALAEKIKDVGDFNGQSIGNALFGLQNLSDGPEVRAVLGAFAEKINDVKDFKGQHLGMALLGLKNLRDSPEVRAVLNALAEKIKDVGDFNGQSIGNALFGLKRLSDSPEVRAVLNALAEKIKDVKDFNGQNMGNALFGLRNLSICPEVRAVLNALAEKIEKVSDFNRQAIGNALFGLKNLRDCPEVRAVLNALAKKIKDVEDFKGQEIGNALCGLACLGECQESKALLDRILMGFSQALGPRKFNTKAIVDQHFFKWLSPASHLEAKLAFLAHIRQPQEDWTKLAHCLKPSDYLALQQLELHRPELAGRHVRALLKTINDSNDPALVRLKQLATPRQQIDRLLASASLPSASDEPLLYAAIEDLQTHLERPLDGPNGMLERQKGQEQMQQLQRRLQPSLTLASLNPRCSDIRQPQEIWLGPAKNHSATPAHDLVIMLPTRGCKPDVPVEDFLQSLDQSLSAAKHFDSQNQSVLVVLGINGRATDAGANEAIESRSEAVDHLLSSPSTGASYRNNIQIKLLTFAWSTDQRKGGKEVIPFGTIRSHCFEHAAINKQADARFISMDGDTTLTGPAIDLIMKLNPDEATTLAYQLPSASCQQHPKTAQALELHWKIQAKVNRTTNEPQASTTSLAYPAEPCLAVGSKGFAHLSELHRDKGVKIYGPTDCEGRFLMRHLSSAGQRFLPVDDKVCVDFHNFKRFEVKDYSIDSTEALISQLSAMAGQSQNMSNLDFFTRQLAFGLSIHDASVRPLTKHFYVPGLLKQGGKLEKIYELSRFKLNTEKLDTEKPSSDAWFNQKLQDIDEAYARVKDLCGEDLAKVVLDNSKRWVAEVAMLAMKLFARGNQGPRGNSPSAHGQASAQAGVAAAPSQGQANKAGQTPYWRPNKSVRPMYPQDLTRQAPSKGAVAVMPNLAAQASQRAQLLPGQSKGVVALIPKERHATKADHSLAQGGQKRPMVSEQERIPRKKKAKVEVAEEVDSAPAIHLQALALPRSSEPMEQPLDVRADIDRAFEEAGSLIHDVFSLLEPHHFGSTRLMSRSEIRHEFDERVMAQMRARGVSASQLNMNELLRDTIKDLLLNAA